LYSWGVVIRRGRAVALINNVETEDFVDTARFALRDNKVGVRKSTYVRYEYLYEGDTVRCEQIKLATLERALTIVRSEQQSDAMRLVFYHLDEHSLCRYSNENLKELCRSFYNPSLIHSAWQYVEKLWSRR